MANKYCELSLANKYYRPILADNYYGLILTEKYYRLILAEKYYGLILAGEHYGQGRTRTTRTCCGCGWGVSSHGTVSQLCQKDCWPLKRPSNAWVMSE